MITCTWSGPIMILYKNWRGETAIRHVRPICIWYGTTPYHPEPQWFMKATDLVKNEIRDFALNDAIEHKPETSDE